MTRAEPEQRKQQQYSTSVPGIREYPTEESGSDNPVPTAPQHSATPRGTTSSTTLLIPSCYLAEITVKMKVNEKLPHKSHARSCTARLQGCKGKTLLPSGLFVCKYKATRAVHLFFNSSVFLSDLYSLLHNICTINVLQQFFSF